MKKKLSVIIAGLLCFLTFSVFAPQVRAEDETIWCDEPVALAFDGCNMWAVDIGDGQWSYLRQIRPHDGVRLRSIPLPEYSFPNDAISDGKSIWVSYEAGVFEIRTPPAFTHFHSRPTYSDTCYVADPLWAPPDWLVPVALAFDGTNLWLADAVNDVVIRIRVSPQSWTELVDTVYLPDGSSPSDLIFDGENIWVANEGSNVVMKIEASADDLSSEDAILDTVSVIESPGKLAYDGDNIWVTHPLIDVLTKIRIADSSVSTYSLPDGSHPTVLTFDRVNMWVANLGQSELAASVMKLSTDGVILDTFELGVGANPVDLVFDGSYVWVACSGGSCLKKLPASVYPLTLEVSAQCGLSSGDPIKGAEVRLYTWWHESWWVEGGYHPGVEFSELEAVSQTDENGEFVIEVPWTDLKECIPSQHPEGATDVLGPRMFGVHVEVFARNEAADIRLWDGTDLAHPEGVLPPTDPALTYFMRIPELDADNDMFIIDNIVEEALADGEPRAQVDIGYAEPDESFWLRSEKAFHILNAIGDAWNLLISVETDLPYPVRPPPVVVAWSTSIGEINQCTTGLMVPLMLQIARSDALRPYAILHEYGHYLARWYGFDLSPGGEYFYDDKLGWSEGWAFFFSHYVRHICYGEPFFYDWDAPPSLGSGSLGAVRELLTVICEEIGFERIWNVCYNHAWNSREFWDGPFTIHDFWFHWFERCPVDQYAFELGRLTFLYQRHGIDNVYKCEDWRVRTDIEFIDPAEIEPGDLELPENADLSNAIVFSADVVDQNVDPTDDGYTDVILDAGELDVETCLVYKQGVGPLDEVDFMLWSELPTTKPPGVPVFARNVANNYIIVRLYVGDPLLGVVHDSFPPATQLTIGEPKFVDITDTYVTSATLFTLTAEDNPYGAVASTAYRIRNITCESDWIEYIQAFQLIELSDGIYHIDYNSTDNAGNVESTNTETVILDNTAPTIITSSPNHGQDYRHSETLLIDLDVTDEWSGVFTISVELDGSPVNDGDLIDLLSLTLNTHTITVMAVDNLGHTATASVTFDVVADVYSLIDLVQRFHGNGQIDDLEVRDGLLDKLNAAKELIEAGKIGPARNILRAFINQVEASLAHHITEEAAIISFTDVRYAIENL